MGVSEARGHTATSYKQKANPLYFLVFLLLKVTSYKQSTKAFRNKNLKSADGWRDGREEEEEEEEWLVTFGTVLAMVVS